MPTPRWAGPIAAAVGPVAVPGGQASDIDLVRSVAPDPVIPLIDTIPVETDETAGLSYILRQLALLRTGEGVSWVIEDTQGAGVGQAEFVVRAPHRGSVSCWVTPAARGRGHSVAALGTLVGWAWSLPGVARLEAVAEPWNEWSLRSLESAGFEREGVLRNWEIIGGEPKDMVMLSHPGCGGRRSRPLTS